MLPPPKRLGPYRIECMLGAGGMAAVYKAHDPRSNRSVAVKILPELDRPELKKRFEREAMAIARLSHPNVIRIFDLDLEHVPPYYVMDYVEARPLDSLLHEAYRVRKTGFDGPGLAALGVQLAAALDYAHGKGVLHRDVKPANLLVTARGRLILMDFGLASVTGRTRLTRTGQVMGTVRYMAPEQLQGEELGPAADVYAMGLVLYELAAGMLPFEDPNPVTMAVRRTQSALPLPRELRLQEIVPLELERLILRCLEAEPSDRPSAAEVMTSMDAFRAPTTGGATGPGGATLESFRPLSAETERQIRESEATERRLRVADRPDRRLLGAVVVVVVAALLGLAGWGLRGTAPPPAMTDLAVARSWRSLVLRWTSPSPYRAELVSEGRVLAVEAEASTEHMLVLDGAAVGARRLVAARRVGEEESGPARVVLGPAPEDYAFSLTPADGRLVLNWRSPVDGAEERIEGGGGPGAPLPPLRAPAPPVLVSRCPDGSERRLPLPAERLFAEASRLVDGLRSELAALPDERSMDDRFKAYQFRLDRGNLSPEELHALLSPDFPRLLAEASRAEAVLAWLTASTLRDEKDARRDLDLYERLLQLRCWLTGAGLASPRPGEGSFHFGPRIEADPAAPRRGDLELYNFIAEGPADLKLRRRGEAGRVSIFTDGIGSLELPFERPPTWSGEGEVDLHLQLRRTRSNQLCRVSLNGWPPLYCPLLPSTSKSEGVHVVHRLPLGWLRPGENALSLQVQSVPGSSCPDTRMTVCRAFLRPVPLAGPQD